MSDRPLREQYPNDYMRFAAKIAVNPESGCWEWTGGRNARVYGGFTWVAIGQAAMPAHRAAWMLLRGPIPEGLTIDHLCRNHPCVNPDHLEPVTQAENNRRAHGGKTHCIRGHAFTEETTARSREGWRHCRICRRALRKGRY